MRTYLRWCLVLSLSMGATLPAFALDKQTQSWALACASCHGADGNSQTGIPSIAGKQNIPQIFAEFRSGKRESTLMQQIAKGYSDAQIVRIATYFAAQKPDHEK